jgi:hypothetical protein
MFYFFAIVHVQGKCDGRQKLAMDWLSCMMTKPLGIKYSIRRKYCLLASCVWYAKCSNHLQSKDFFDRCIGSRLAGVRDRRVLEVDSKATDLFMYIKQVFIHEIGNNLDAHNKREKQETMTVDSK